MSRQRRNGVSLVYLTVAMTGLLLLGSMAVDYGRVQLAKTQLSAAAVASARAGAAGLATDIPTAQWEATRIASANICDGQAITLRPSEDIEYGNWNPTLDKDHRFIKLTGLALANADTVRITTRRLAARGEAIPLMFSKIYHVETCDLKAVAAAQLIPGINVNQNVQGTANPFLAGMPKGTVASLNNPHNSPDYAGDATNPRQSPFSVNMPIVPDTYLTFDTIDGLVGHDPNLLAYNPDGQLDDIGHNTNGSEHGISDIISPINALVGVFLGPDRPDLTNPPSTLDFSTAASRNFDELQPDLKQIFFIGDGRSTTGIQKFKVPQGATRLYLATWDFFEWNNNYGFRNIKISRPSKVVTVQ